jgi:hypothetical protein
LHDHDHGTVVTVLSEGVAVAVERGGLRVAAQRQFSEMVRLFRDVIGMPLDREAIGMAGFRLNDGAVLEIYGPADELHSFFTTASGGLARPNRAWPPLPLSRDTNRSRSSCSSSRLLAGRPTNCARGTASEPDHESAIR